jgi:hypothetical protein
VRTSRTWLPVLYCVGHLNCTYISCANYPSCRAARESVGSINQVPTPPPPFLQHTRQPHGIPYPPPLGTFSPPPLPLQVHGTCLGFEILAIVISRNTSVLADMDALNAPAPLLYTERAATSDWLRALPPHVVTNLQNQALAMENHAHGERGPQGPARVHGSAPTVCSRWIHLEALMLMCVLTFENHAHGEKGACTWVRSIHLTARGEIHPALIICMYHLSVSPLWHSPSPLHSTTTNPVCCGCRSADDCN